jgi:mannose-6-phosphate isomerase-like protein (cupin superfamily)
LSARDIVCEDLSLAIDDLRHEGYRLDVIYPADDPATAVLSRGGETVRLALPNAAPLPAGPPHFAPRFALTRAGAATGQGRAGMLYRDLIPGRLGGRYIASHITITEGGPVSDWVHYHRVLVQMIFVRRGWVRVVYEDQGEPFVMRAGDLVLQPPLIRHRVLESSPGLEVIEISAPALHETFADHELELPGGDDPDRDFKGQHFLRHIAANTSWTPFNGGEAQETGMGEATGVIAEVSVIRAKEGAAIAFAPHQGELVFGFVLDGTARLDRGAGHQLNPADAFVIPPGEAWTLSTPSRDFQLLHVTTAPLDAAAQCLL